MSTPTLDSFFSGGGGKSISWKDKPIGTTVSGTILAVNPPQQQTDPVDGSLQFKKDGVTPKMSVRIDLRTGEHDPSDPDDDGTRSLFVQGWLQGAIGDALRKAGRQGPPEVGAHLTVTLSERTPNENKALNPTNKFVAQYVSPASQATGQFFDQAGAAAGQAAAGQFANGVAGVIPQPNISGTGYVQPPAAQPPFQVPTMTPEQVAAFMAQQGIAQPAPAAQPEPAKPAQLSDEAWKQMDPATKQRVAASMAGIPF